MEMEELSVNLSGLDGEVQDASKMLEATHTQVVAMLPHSYPLVNTGHST